MPSDATSPSASTVGLDDMLETDPAAKWLKMKPRELLLKSKGRNRKVPGFWINKRVVRFNPRTIIAKMASDAGVAPEIIAASFGIFNDRNNNIPQST